MARSGERRTGPSLLAAICLLVLLLGSSCGSRTPGSPSSGTLRTVAQVRRLSPSTLREGLGVQLEGIVTFCDDRSHQILLQDDGGGIAVQMGGALEGVRSGDRVSVSGFTAYEAFAPLIVKPRLVRMGSAPLPPCLKADSDRLFKGGMDCVRVEIEAEVVASVVVGAIFFEMRLQAGEHPFRVVGGFVSQVPLHRLTHARVRVRGVPVTTFSPDGRVHSLTLYASEPADLQALSLASPGADAAQSAGDLRVLPQMTRIGSIKALSNLQAGSGYPVSVRGVVTYWDPGRDHLFLEDATGGIYVQPPEFPLPDLETGCLLEVEGRSGSGSFAPVLVPRNLRVLGRAPMPVPLRVDPSTGISSVSENRWAMVEGVIRRAQPAPHGGASLVLRAGTNTYDMTLLGPPSAGELEHLVDRRVRVQGVHAPIFDETGRFAGYRLYTPSPRWMEVLDPAGGDGFDSLPRRIHSLMEYSPEGQPVHRVKVAGRITHLGSDGSIYLADTSGGIRLEGRFPDTPNVGDSVMALGFLEWDRASAVIQDAVLRPASNLPVMPPVPIAAEASLSGAYDAHLVQVEGFIRECTLSSGDRVLSLESGRTTFTAVLEHPQAFPGSQHLREGALVRLTGVCDLRWDARALPPSPESLRLLLRSPSDIVLLRGAPWWTLSRALVLAMALVVLLLVVAVWLVHSRRQVRAGTELLQMQMRQREALEEQLRQSQKLESVGRLAGGVAHDFNNLLTVISGYCELLTLGLPQEGELGACAQEIRKAAERAAGLTRQLLAFSRKQILQPVVLDLNELVTDMEQMLRRLISEDIELVTRTAPEPCPIKVDPGQISQVLMNLAVNARDAMPGGGQIILETRHVRLDPEDLKARPDVDPGRYVQLTVTDTGTGMDAQTLSQVFEPFFTTKGQGKGTGLGLSTVFGIVKQSGGHIWTHSEPGLGTTFKLFFPEAEETLHRQS